MRDQIVLTEQCFLNICFIPLDTTGAKFFGFSEFLAGLALMVLAWTIGDVRYRFRIQAAPIPLRGITFSVVTAVGILTLLTDLWRAQQWLVPKGNLLTPASWQALLGGAFLLTFLVWAWFAFIRPPIFGKRNTERYAQSLYRFILKGSPVELAVIADELVHSARPLIRYAFDKTEIQQQRRLNQNKWKNKNSKIGAYANDLLLLIADKRLCRAIVESSPGTALAIFQEIGDTKKYGVQVEIFSKNIINEAILNRDSFLYHETEEYDSGLIGHHKPLSHAMFSNYLMVENIGTLLDPDLMGNSKWDAGQWDAYCRVLLMTFTDYSENYSYRHSSVLYRAMSYLEGAASDLYTLNGVANVPWDNDALSRMRVIIDFICEAVEVLEKQNVPEYFVLRVRDDYGPVHKTAYDHLAGLVFEVIFSASAVKFPKWDCWMIQHNSVWGRLFNDHRLSGVAGRIVKFKVRRLLYNEVVRMKEFPNFKGAKIIGFCLNVMGFSVGKGEWGRDSRPLQKVVLSWTKNNYVGLRDFNPAIAEACLVETITYDSERCRLVRTSAIEGTRAEPWYEYLDLVSNS